MRARIFVCAAALLVGVVAFGGYDRARAQSAEQACTPDAMRICSQFIPDRARVTTCMLSHRAELSEACRLAMGGGGKRVATRHRRAVVHCRHGRRC
jgi:hypothetical protein